MCLLVKWSHSLLSALKSMPEVTAQSWAESKSLLKAWHVSSWLFPRENTVESSAKIDGFPTRLVDKSSMNTRKSVSPNTVPWGIPHERVAHSECIFPTLTLCLWFAKNEFIHFKVCGENQHPESLKGRPAVGTRLYALLKSRKAAWTHCLWFRTIVHSWVR